MTRDELLAELREMERLYTEHGKNQQGETLEIKNRLHLELSNRYLRMKPYIKKRTKFQWYDPVYNYAITGNKDYIEAAREDLAEIIRQYESTEAGD
jgi:hypothetical protein